MVLDRLLRAGEGRILRRLKAISQQVNTLEPDFESMTDAELRAMTDEYRQRLADGESLDDLLPEAFATVREAAKRTLGQRHFDVQIMGGGALHLGNIAEMKTGEGKTLVSTLPAYLNGLAGHGVHIVTVNDYLAQRDAENMGRVHRFLGLTVGVIHPQMAPQQRRPAYGTDITYGTNNEFGFDYLRDNMSWSAEELVQRGHHYAIVDEVDSILVDEARTPLIISGPSDQSSRLVHGVRPDGRPGSSGTTTTRSTRSKRTVAITEDGVATVEDQLGIENLYESVNTPLVGYPEQRPQGEGALQEGQGLHRRPTARCSSSTSSPAACCTAAATARGCTRPSRPKKSVEIKQENQTLATITLQNYFRLYDKLAGMTGTAMTEAAEFSQIYKLGVVPIPTNMPMIREDLSDVVYKTEVAKFDAVVDDLAERYDEGQPVLVGTTSVQKSEYLSRPAGQARRQARGAQRQAARAGGGDRRPGRPQGRDHGRDQHGRPRHRHHARRQPRLPRRLRAAAGAGLNPLDNLEDYEAAWSDELAKQRKEVSDEHEEVVGLGGLYVLGTERHESRRIDNQLRGRSGRQGDPGESRFYLSLGDDLMRLFNAAAVESIMNRLNIPEDVPIESKIVTRAIRSAQTQVEGQNFEIRKNVLKYDEVLNKQRLVIYAERRKMLEGTDLDEQVRHFIGDTVAGYVRGGDVRGLPGGVGPRPALDGACAPSTRFRSRFPTTSGARP